MTIKQKLVDRMIAKGNNFTYTEMIKELLDVVTDGKVKYDWREHRGYYATNFSVGAGGYMVSGQGNCGVYRSENGKWHAKYYTVDEMLDYKINKVLQSYKREVRSVTCRTIESPELRRVLSYKIESDTKNAIKSLKRAFKAIRPETLTQTKK